MAKYMPRLQALSIPVRANVDLPLTHKLHTLMLAPSSSQLELQFLSCEFATCFPTVMGFESPDEVVDTVAAGLHALWPSGVTCGTYRKAGDGSGVRWMDRLNAELKRLREFHGYGNPQTEVVPRKYSHKRVPPWLERA
ncbi:hypothetical protein RSAG8_04596, partial [Rhizoctonia solani AG-8 WAC10335]